MRPAEAQGRVLLIELVSVIERKRIRSIVRLVAEAELGHEPMRAFGQADGNVRGRALIGTLADRKYILRHRPGNRPALRRARNAIEGSRVSRNRRWRNRQPRKR